MPDARTFDVIVLGAGAVGENAADRAARTGLSVAVVEHERVGGECSYWACMPSKALLRPNAALTAARAVPGVAISGGLDVGAVLARRDEIVHHWDDGSQVSWLEGAGLTLVRGAGRITGPRTVAVEDADVVLTARHAVVVSTGSEPVLPSLPGLDTITPWTSREVTSMHEVPGSVVVVGGGVVGCEMATALADLGATVTMLVRGDRLLAGMEPFAGEAVASSLAAMGVVVRLGTSATAVAADGDGVLVTIDDGSTARADRLLLATGRRPRTRDLGLETIGLTPGGPVAVDDTGLATGVAGGWLYATGDGTGRTNTTHQGKYDARATGDAIAHRFGGGQHGSLGATAVDSAGDWSRFRATADHGAVPQVVFTRPEVAAVGLTEAAARARGLDVRVVTVGFDSTAGAVVSSADRGTASLVVDEGRGVIVGATFVGPEVAEMLHAATIAVVGEVPLTRLWHAVPAYPTRSEVWLRLLEAYGL
ncbi:MAG: NAD(P)/FAD-dependent oxidoreductase [Cellulomonas sp.]|nr:NAD(P)/FAD-dependent oxidoreductase [Cellulomonas sp.]